MRTLFLTLLFVGFSVLATEDVIDFESKEQEDLYRVLVKELRCPKCQNQNIADSNAVVAKDMRVKTIDLVKQGKNKQEVVDYMVDRYGQFAHYKPPVNTATSMLWVLPIAFVLLALLLLAKRSRGSSVQVNQAVSLGQEPLSEQEPLSDQEPQLREALQTQLTEDDELKALLEQASQSNKEHK